jgi:hypothetical protein
MSAGATKWVWENSRASNGSLIVLLAIADECGKEGTTEMKVAELEAKSRLSERALRMAVRDLEALGKICLSPQKNRRSSQLRQNLPHPKSRTFLILIL